MRISSRNSSNDGNSPSQRSKSKKSNMSQSQNLQQQSNHQTPQNFSHKIQNPRSQNQYQIKQSAITFKQSPNSILQNQQIVQKKFIKQKVSENPAQQINIQPAIEIKTVQQNQQNQNNPYEMSFNEDNNIVKQAIDGKDQNITNAKDPNEKLFCVINGNGYNIIKNSLLLKPGWKEVKKDELWTKMMGPNHSVNFIWKPTNFNYKMYSQIDQVQHRNLLVGQNKEIVVNHLEGHREITTKTGLIRSLKYYYKDNVNFIENNYQVFDSIPTSFVISSKLETYEYQQFLQRFEELAQTEGKTIKEKVPDKHCKNNIWLIKPANENQGKGIKIFDNLEQIVRFLESSLQFSYWVIQKYLERPLLFKGRKFDLRMWGFAHSNLDFYFYDTGYLRTSSQEYTTDTKVDEFVHLTNNCLQKLNKDTYGMHEEGNTVSLEQFQEYLDQNFGQYKLQVYEHFILRMKDLALDCYMSCKNVLNPAKRRNSFEFFGFDFMIDEDFRVWLIEVNTNPYIGIHNQGMKHILPEMFKSLYKIVLDPIFETNLTQNEIENPSEGTQFDLLYSRTKGIYKRRPVQEGIYPIKELDPRKQYPKRQNPKKIVKKTLDEKVLQTQQINTVLLQDIKMISGQKLENKSGKKQQNLNQSQNITNGEINTSKGNYNSTQRVDRIARGSSNQFLNSVKNNQFTDNNNSLNNQTIELVDQDQEKKRGDFNNSVQNQNNMKKRNDVSLSLEQQTNYNSASKKLVQNKQQSQNSFQIRNQKQQSASKVENKKLDEKSQKMPNNNLKKVNTNTVIDEELDLSQLSSNYNSQNENQMSRSITSGGVKNKNDKIQQSNGYVSRNIISGQSADNISQFQTPQIQKNRNKKVQYLPVLEQQNEHSQESIHHEKRDSLNKNEVTNNQQKNYLPKTIVQQVKSLDKKSQFCNQHIQHILHRIKATYRSWELFSDQQIKDANLAFKMMLQTVSLTVDQQIPLVRVTSLLIASNEVPINLRYELGKILFQIMKNKMCARTLLEDQNEIKEHLKNQLKVLQESCNQNQNSDHMIEYQTEMHEIQILCSTILIQMMSLTNRKYYIPGETSENTKQRAKAILTGIHMVLLFTYLNTKNERLKQFLNEDFIERLDEADIQLHFQNTDKILQDFNNIYSQNNLGAKEFNYNEDEIAQPVSSMSLPLNLQGQNHQEQMQEFLKQKLQKIQFIIQKDQQMMIQKKQEDEQREIQQRKLTEQEMKEKRQRAEDAMKRRIKEIKERNITENNRQANLGYNNEKKQEFKGNGLFEKIDKIPNKIFGNQQYEKKSQNNQQNQQYLTTQTPQLINNLIISAPQSIKKQDVSSVTNYNNYHLDTITPQVNNQQDNEKALSAQRIYRSPVIAQNAQANSSNSTRPQNPQFLKCDEIAEQILQDEEKKRQDVVIQLRKKQELRKKRENSEKRRKIMQDKIFEEEQEKKRLQKEQDRKQALEEWLRGKKSDYKKKSQFVKFTIDRKQNQQNQTLFTKNIIQNDQNIEETVKNSPHILFNQMMNENNQQNQIQRATSLSCKLSHNNEGFTSPSLNLNKRNNQINLADQKKDIENRHKLINQKNEQITQNQSFLSSQEYESQKLIDGSQNNIALSDQVFSNQQQKYLNNLKLAQLSKIQFNIDQLTKQRRQIIEGNTSMLDQKYLIPHDSQIERIGLAQYDHQITHKENELGGTSKQNESQKIYLVNKSAEHQNTFEQQHFMNQQLILQSQDLKNEQKLFQKKLNQESQLIDYLQQNRDIKITSKKNINVPTSLGIRYENLKIDKGDSLKTIQQQSSSGKNTLPNIMDKGMKNLIDQNSFDLEQITQSANRFQISNNQNAEKLFKNLIRDKESNENKHSQEQQFSITKNSLSSSLPDANINNFVSHQQRQRFGSEGGVVAISNAPTSIFVEKQQNTHSEIDESKMESIDDKIINVRSHLKIDLKKDISPTFINTQSGQTSMISKKKRKQMQQNAQINLQNQYDLQRLISNQLTDGDGDDDQQDSLSDDSNIDQSTKQLLSDVKLNSLDKNQKIIQLLAPNITVINNDFSQINNFSQQQMQQIMKNEKRKNKAKKKKRSSNQIETEYGVYDTFNNIGVDKQRKVIGNTEQVLNNKGKSVNPKKRNKMQEMVASNGIQKKKLNNKSQKDVFSKELIQNIYSANYLQNIQNSQFQRLQNLQ